MKSVFSYDKENHIYKYKNYVIPSVTGVIKDNFGTPPWYNDWYAQRGRAIHLAIHLLINNKLDWKTVDDRIKSRVLAFVKFLNQCDLKPINSEVVYFNKYPQFGGTIDVIFLNPKDKIIIMDIKSTLERNVEIQLGGYCVLWDSNNNKKVQQSAALQLKDDGDYEIHWINDDIRNIKNVFLACLTISNWMNKK